MESKYCGDGGDNHCNHCDCLAPVNTAVRKDFDKACVSFSNQEGTKGRKDEGDA